MAWKKGDKNQYIFFRSIIFFVEIRLEKECIRFSVALAGYAKSALVKLHQLSYVFMMRLLCLQVTVSSHHPLSMISLLSMVHTFYVQVTDDDPDSITATLRARLTSNDPNLTTSERLQIRQFLEAYQQEG